MVYYEKASNFKKFTWLLQTEAFAREADSECKDLDSNIQCFDSNLTLNKTKQSLLKLASAIFLKLKIHQV